MTSVAAGSRTWSFHDNALAAAEKVDAAALDAQIDYLWTEIDALLTALTVSIRGDNTLTDDIVRIRNLHDEVLALIQTGAATAVAPTQIMFASATGGAVGDARLAYNSATNVLTYPIPVFRIPFGDGSGAATSDVKFIYTMGFGLSLTGDTTPHTRPLFDLNPYWIDVSNKYTGFQVDVTWSASAADSAYIRCSKNGADVFKVLHDGTTVIAGKLTAKVAVPASFADLAAVQTYLASIIT